MAKKQGSTAGRKPVDFQFFCEPGNRVFLAGSFTQWAIDRKELVDRDNSGSYCARVMLEPGTYEYKFIVNETWVPDPDNPRFNINEMGTLNSVKIVE